MESKSQVLAEVANYIAEDVLEGEDVGLEGNTPLLELGVLNSMEIVRLVEFVSDFFGVDIDGSMILADNFKDLETISEMVAELLEVHGTGVR